MQHLDAATVARLLIADTPGTAALPPDQRDQLHQTVEDIITRARRAQHLPQEQRPWAKSYHAQTGRDARRGDVAAGGDEENAS